MVNDDDQVLHRKPVVPVCPQMPLSIILTWEPPLSYPAPPQRALPSTIAFVYLVLMSVKVLLIRACEGAASVLASERARVGFEMAAG